MKLDMNEKQGNCGPKGPQIKKLHNTKSSSNFIFFGCTFLQKSAKVQISWNQYFRVYPDTSKSNQIYFCIDCQMISNIMSHNHVPGTNSHRDVLHVKGLDV